MAMTLQFFYMTSSSIFWRWFVSLVKFSFWSKFHANIITGLFRSYDNFFSYGIDQKSGNWKYPHLSFAQYLETGASKEYQISRERL